MTTESLKLYCDAKQAFDRDDYPCAIRLLGQSLVEGEHFKSHELLGQCHQRLGNLPRAVNEYRLALGLNPRSNKSACLLASALCDQGDVATAKAILASLLERCPTYGLAKALRSILGAIPPSANPLRPNRG